MSTAPIAMSDDAREVRRRLREIRRQKGLSLQDVERLSGGRWKAATVGSYERGDRGLRPNQLAALADFYGVPLSSLIPERVQASGEDLERPRIRIDLTHLENVPYTDRKELERFTDAIRSRRGDYRSDRLTIRYGDISVLCLLLKKNPDRLVADLREWNVLMTDSS